MSHPSPAVWQRPNASWEAFSVWTSSKCAIPHGMANKRVHRHVVVMLLGLWLNFCSSVPSQGVTSFYVMLAAV